MLVLLEENAEAQSVTEKIERRGINCVVFDNIRDFIWNMENLEDKNNHFKGEFPDGLLIGDISINRTVIELVKKWYPEVAENLEKAEYIPEAIKEYFARKLQEIKKPVKRVGVYTAGGQNKINGQLFYKEGGESLYCIRKGMQFIDKCSDELMYQVANFLQDTDMTR